MRYIGDFFHDAYKVRCYWRWWAGWVSSPLFRWELDLQSNAFADSLPTQILNKYVKGGQHYQCQNINRADVKERRPALYVYGAVHRIIYISKRILYMISFYHYKHQQYVLYYHSAFRLLDMMDRLLKFHQFLYQF